MDRRGFLCDKRGQATVEAAFALPVLMLLVLLLLQPAIVLYDRMVMQQAASEGCRLLATLSAGSEQQSEDYIRRRLSPVPQQDLFHVHDGGCTWVIETTGNEASHQVSVRISNEIEPLPLLGAAAGLFGLTNEEGHLTVQVACTMETQPAWVAASESGIDPRGWIGAWLT